VALKVWDGFDHYLNATDWKSRLNNFVQYQQPATNGTPISFVTGRNGFGKALYLEQGNTYSYAVFGQRAPNAFIGFACQFNETGTGADFTFFDTVTGLGNINVFFNPANYAVQVYRGDRQVSGAALLYASPNNQWADNVWNFIEIWPIINSLVWIGDGARQWRDACHGHGRQHGLHRDELSVYHGERLVGRDGDACLQYFGQSGDVH
jgi:hypothetical protein